MVKTGQVKRHRPPVKQLNECCEREDAHVFFHYCDHSPMTYINWNLLIILTNELHVTVPLFRNRSHVTIKCGRKEKKSGFRGTAEWT